jgi:hypothetical protein
VGFVSWLECSGFYLLANSGMAWSGLSPPVGILSSFPKSEGCWNTNPEVSFN